MKPILHAFFKIALPSVLTDSVLGVLPGRPERSDTVVQVFWWRDVLKRRGGLVPVALRL